MGRNCRNVGDEILGIYLCRIFLSKEGKQFLRHVGDASILIAPERENAATQGSFILIEICYEARECTPRSHRWGRSRYCRHAYLPLSPPPPTDHSHLPHTPTTTNARRTLP